MIGMPVWSRHAAVKFFAAIAGYIVVGQIHKGKRNTSGVVQQASLFESLAPVYVLPPALSPSQLL